MTKLKFVMKQRKHLAKLSALAGFLILVSGLLYGQEATPKDLPPGDGREVIAVACTQCHSLAPIMMMRDGTAGWKRFVQNMILRGAQLTPQESDTVVQYLASNFGPGANPMKSGARMESLPDGAGKELVESRCSLCHDLGRITSVKRNKSEWDRTVRDMVAQGAPATPEQIQAITSYLTSHFVRKPE